jgi:hypothetical protein
MERGKTLDKRNTTPVMALRSLKDFGTRSAVTHIMMAMTGIAGVASALFIEGTVGDISFVAFINFTAGLWVAQSVHSLGNSYTDDDYDGMFGYIRDRV